MLKITGTTNMHTNMSKHNGTVCILVQGTSKVKERGMYEVCHQIMTTIIGIFIKYKIKFSTIIFLLNQKNFDKIRSDRK